LKEKINEEYIKYEENVKKAKDLETKSTIYKKLILENAKNSNN
jgi:hypothetical protein